MSEVAIRQSVPIATTRAVFTVTIFIGSFLLFLVQPMFARMILPELGGAPSVWNTAMLCYQGMLLLGYLYAHSISRWPIKRQVATHLALLVIAAATLPIGLASVYPDPTGFDPALWLIGLLIVSIGPVFFAVSAQAPLMQCWFSRSDDPTASNPYFLYAASNTGSLLALICYPLLLEPNLKLASQSWLWSIGFIMLAFLVAACALILPRTQASADRPLALATAEPITWRKRLHWTALSAIPSGLLLSTTTHITTDVMAMPLLWVIPLALYLLTFIIAFATGGAGLRRGVAACAPYIVYGLGCFVMVEGDSKLLAFGLQLVLLFVAALGLHIALANRRPAAEQLTEFYLWMSIGGVLGGLFCALVAPILFDWTYEHLILVVAAAALLPAAGILPSVKRLWDAPRSSRHARYGLPLLFLGLAILGFVAGQISSALLLILFTIMFLLGFAAIGRPAHMAWCMTMLMLVAGGWANLKVSADPGARERSFFGVSTVIDTRDGTLRKLVHGTTVHGMQSLRPGHETDRLAYYAPGSGISMVMGALPAAVGPAARVAFVGLGAGTLACFSSPDQSWTAYEIDPTVIKIARDEKRFSFISRCNPNMRIVLGDARLTLGKESAGAFDIVVADAFSSDSIPLHLMTAEAFDGYKRVLAKNGIIMVNISNRYLDMEPVIAALAAERGWAGRVRAFRPDRKALARHAAVSKWVLLAESEQRMAGLLKSIGSRPGDWEGLKGRPEIGPWTDDFSSVLPVIDLQ